MQEVAGGLAFALNLSGRHPLDPDLGDRLL